ncbi:MAG TPA: hypothetical protein VGD24_07370 [Gallionella sp.]
MFQRLAQMLLTVIVLAAMPSFACDSTIECDKCAKESEFSWNPSDRYVTPRLSRFYSLGDDVTAAYMANNFARAKVLASEYAELASIYRCNWNYGNAIHDVNRVLGLISLSAGEIDAAAEYLIKAGKSTGSPQLNTFGPELDLANQLLQRGKVDSVKTYLVEIKSFWEMNNGQVDTWLADIEKGGKPELDRFAGNKPGPLMLLLFWTATLWPIIASIGFLYVQRKRITRKAFFLFTAAVSGYVVMFAVHMIAGYCMQAVLSRMDVGLTTLFLLSYAPLVVEFVLPVLAMFFLARFFYHGSKK